MFFAFLLTMGASSRLTAQTEDQKRWLEQFSRGKAQLWQQQRAEAESLAGVLGLTIREEFPDGVVIELQRFENGLPVYYITHNLNAARTISTDRVWPGGSGGFSLTGSTDTLAIWDEAKVRDTHQEFGGRVIVIDNVSLSQHATHVAGTMIAAGVDANAKGMSFQGRLRSYDWNADLSEMAAAAAGGLRVSNHSYGLITGWRFTGSSWQWWGNTVISPTEDYYFGFYSSEAQDWDVVARNAPYYLIVKSAGNDRGDGPSSQPVTHSHSGTGSFTDTHELDGGTDGYDCISHAGVSKNILTIGAVNDIPGGYTQPSDVVMSSFSSWGPTDDGRIKPDIVANGVALYSANSSSNTSYITFSGTSMSSPNVSGSLGLLLHHRKNLFGNNPMRASTLKALVIHTADESGANPGPDYIFGWGLMNTLKAVQVMSTDGQAGGSKHIRELTLSQGQTIDITAISNGSQPLRATICWTDPAGTPPPPSLNPSTIMLVNDLDLRVIQSTTTYFPWILNPSSPSAPATGGDNIRDNVEQVYIASPTAGVHTIRIMHKGLLSGGSQVVSLVITGVTFDSSVTVTVPNGGETWAIGTMQAVQWTSSGLTGDVKIELSRNGGASFTETLFASTTNDGSENWTVTGPTTSTARIKISSVANPAIADTSNANFSIVQPTITVLSPNGGETWSTGSSQTIQWNSSFVTGNVKIELSRNGGATFSEVLFTSTANDNSENWTVTGPATSSARVRISSVSDPSVADTSDANFSIVQPTITVLVPNGGETWAIGTSQSIEWNSSFVTGNVKIELSRNGGSTFNETLFASTANDSSENWMVTGPVTSQARIRISSVSDPSIADTNNANFSIAQSTITVTLPNGGEHWILGSSEDIQWTSANLTDNVKIELSRNGGGSYETLFASTANDGSEPWVVTEPMTANALMKISSVSNPSVFDVSNSPFTIRVDFIVLTKIILRDNGGETDSLDFGTAPGATDGIDEIFGEYELPPIPPFGVFDVRWQVSGIQGMKRDIRDTLGGSRELATYTGKLQAGEGGFPFHLRWNPLELPDSGSFILRYLAETLISINMKQQDSAVITDAETFQVIYSLGTTVSSTVQQGWNIVSVPVTVADLRKIEVFPTSTSNAFAYGPSGYVARDTLDYGVGYWLKFDLAQAVSVTGGTRSQDTIDVVTGWNIIGSISDPVTVGSIVQIPSGIVVSSYFGYGSTGYTPATTIEPMKGYWVKVNQNGQLVLIGGAIARPARTSTGTQ
jgi:hypothetical protein